MFYHLHHRQLPAEDQKYGLRELRRCWQLIDRRALAPHTVRKFGYCPMPCWTLFRLEEWLYFTLRGLLGRNS